MGILPVLVLLVGKMPAPQETLGYFFIWKSPKFNFDFCYTWLPDWLKVVSLSV
jgi:hypothetical protein